jgi:hypothetical protein
MIGIALDFFGGLIMSERLILILPKIDDLRLEDASAPLPAESDTYNASGVNSGASGLKDGPDVEKLNSLLPGVNEGALTLILPLPNVTGSDAGLMGTNDVLRADRAGCGLLAGNVNLPGVNVLAGLNFNSELLAGLNLNSGAATLSLDIEAFETCPRLV